MLLTRFAPKEVLEPLWCLPAAQGERTVETSVHCDKPRRCGDCPGGDWQLCQPAERHTHLRGVHEKWIREDNKGWAAAMANVLVTRASPRP